MGEALMPTCDRCGSTENLQRSLVVDMPARCLSCIDKERGDEEIREEDLVSREQITGMRLW